MPPHREWMSELDGFRFWFNTSDRGMGVAMAMGRYEPASVRFIKQALRPGMTCIDAGAQTGFFTCLMASAVGETGMVYAFEPMPSSYHLLLKNIQENGLGPRVRAYQLACSNGATESRLLRSADLRCGNGRWLPARLDDRRQGGRIVHDAVNLIRSMSRGMNRPHSRACVA